MYNTYKEWEADAIACGYSIDGGGDGKIIAHINGDEKGIFDPNYGGFGTGWFY